MATRLHLSTLLLALALPSCSGGGGAIAVEPEYVGRATCAECHPAEAEAWRGSHHDLAIQEATEETVLGDFDDAEFEHEGDVTRFRRTSAGFVVEAEGPDGERGEWPVTHTFGVDPLQQVLVDLGNGRLQAHTVPWDVEEEEWFTLYPGERYEPGDPLHWTGLYQNWNGMCADCHSTGLRKNYDEATGRFDTTFEELDVACEACHGPGSAHVDWARAFEGEADDELDVGLSVRLRRNVQASQIDTCAPCHSRRTPLASGLRPDDSFHENYQLELLREGSYFADGQIQGEVYVYGSFAQSKMHAQGVTCTDCHDPHSARLHLPGNGLCAQCHSETPPVERFPTLTARSYDTREHHGHEPGTPGSACVDCHMPERTYMQVDPRRDHSFRVPRPDLSVEIGTPNACSTCHEDEGAAWAAARIEEWTETERPPHFGTAFAGARRGDPEALNGLIETAVSRDQPAIVRATALEYLRGAGEIGLQVSRAMLADMDPLVKATAIRGLEPAKPVERLNDLMPLVEHESLPVRIEAARMLAGAPQQVLDAVVEGWDDAIEEWRQVQLLSAEMPWAHHNLGSLAADLGDHSEARKRYRRALELDPYFLPARFNLATHFNQTGRNLEAERVLREGIALLPEEGELHYSLGLLLAELGRLSDAANALLEAERLLPNRPRVRYNAGLALQQAGRREEAEAMLLEANELTPDQPDILHALASFYAEEEAWPLALPYAERLGDLVTDQPWVDELLGEIRDGLAGKPRNGGE